MAKKIVNTKKISREEWLELRKKSIGGSDASKVIGMNPWASAFTLYADKMGMSKDKETSEAMRLGNDLEQYVAERYCEHTGNKVRVDNFMHADDEYEFLTANVDRVIVGQNAGLECKTMSGFNNYDLAAGEIPAQYYCQCQHYMMVMGYDRMDLAVLVFQQGIFVNEVARNDAFIEELRAAEIEFWNKYIIPGEPPAIDGSDATKETIKEVYSDEYEDLDVALDAIDTLATIIAIKKDGIDRLTAEKTEAENKLKKLLSENESSTGHGDRYKSSWKYQNKTSVDSKKLKAEFPDVYDRVTNKSSYKVLRVNEIKKKEK